MANLFDLEIGREYPFKTIGELKDEFYSLMRLPPLKKRGISKIRVIEPQIFVLNPPLFYNSSDPLASELWVAVYYPDQTTRNRMYYVKVTCGRYMMSGPHKFELYFQVRTGHHVRLGCYMPEKDFAFHREDLVKEQLRKAIIWRKYFATDKTMEEVIELRSEGETPDLKVDL